MHVGSYIYQTLTFETQRAISRSQTKLILIKYIAQTHTFTSKCSFVTQLKCENITICTNVKSVPVKIWHTSPQTVVFQMNCTSLLNPKISLIVFTHYHIVFFPHVMHIVTCLGIFNNIVHPLVNIIEKKNPHTNTSLTHPLHYKKTNPMWLGFMSTIGHKPKYD
jgi:hypothetical protein